MRNLHIYWWGGWPWKWRFHYVRCSKWGPFGELVVGPVGFVWPAEPAKEPT